MQTFFQRILRGALLCVSVFFVLVAHNGCVPSPVENTPPAVTDLRTFAIPQNSNFKNLWRTIHNFPRKDTIYFWEYIDLLPSKSFEGYSPIWQVKNSDTLSKDSIVFETYISDSVVEVYGGKSTDSLTPRQIRLHDTLRVGATWIAAPDYVTANGTHVQIKADVIDFYSQSSAPNNMLYNDVFLVSFTSTVKSSGIPEETQYQNGSRVYRYFARNIGVILERARNASDSLLWTKELLETRSR